MNPYNIAFFISFFLLAMISPVCCWAEGNAESLNAHLLRGIETCFAGDYDTAWTIFDEVKAIDPDHPSREFYQATVLFWKNNVDESNPRFDTQITALLLACLKKSEMRIEKNEQDIEALHYMGLAYTYLGRMDAHRGKLYAGGVKGETGRTYLEKAIAYCREAPGETTNSACDICEDIYFPFGAYSYFSGRLPRLLRLFNFLWFIPKGSTEEGLKALSRARENGCLHQLGARTLLTSIYVHFEKGRIRDAFSLSKELVTRFPNNPYLDLEHGRILILLGNYRDTAEHAETILTKVHGKKDHYDHVVELGAKLLIAESALYGNNLNAADDLLQGISNQPRYQNNTLTARIFLLKGQLADLMGKRDAAVSYYKSVLACEGHLHNRTANRAAALYLDAPFTGIE